MCAGGGLEGRAGVQAGSAGARELLEARVCVLHVCAACVRHIRVSVRGYFLSSTSVSCKVHIMVRLFPDLFVPQSCFHNKCTRGVDGAESASRQRSRAHGGSGSKRSSPEPVNPFLSSLPLTPSVLMVFGGLG